MRILILSQWYAPEPMRFLPEMAQSLQRLGHDVEVLTGFPNWPSGRIYPDYRLRPRQVELLDGVRVVRVPLYPNHGTSAVGRAANLGSFVASAVAGGAVSVRRADVVYAIQPPTTCFAAWALSRLWRVPYAFEVQDMWPETLTSTGFVANRHALALVDAYCRWCYRTAAAIRVTSPGFRDNLIRKGVDSSKVVFIPNWVDTDFYVPRHGPPSAGMASIPAGFRILYAGTIGLAQCLATVLDAASALVERTDVQFLFAGEGLELPQLKEAARARGLHNVVFLGRRPLDEMPQLYALADAFLVSLKKDPLFSITIPHKTLTYMAAGKPILAMAEGDLADLIQASGCGLVSPPGDGAALARRIVELTSLHATELAAMGRRGRATACQTFGRERLVQRLGQMLLATTRSATMHPSDAGAEDSLPDTHAPSSVA
jgi:glycosyltransferase involved in cell wall biosynthesis